jgi:hypothetical protein
MADNPMNKKTNYVEYLKVEASQSERRTKLWDALHRFIQGHGAWLISAPGAKFLRIECKQGSALPAKLMELGYSPRHCGTGTRLNSGHTPETIFLPVDILEIKLPGK